MSLTTSSSSLTGRFTHDVFICFGIDTHHGFTGYLNKAFQDRRIRTFIHDMELEREEEITPSPLLKSRIVIIVFSAKYASSFCLDQLSKILDCIKEEDQLVLPVFYYVDPSELRHYYGEALARLDEEKALHQISHLSSGLQFKHGDGYEYEFIERIVEEVFSKINCAPLHVTDYPVGPESQVLDLEENMERVKLKP